MEAKEELKEIFRYAIYRLDNNLCTPAELDSFGDAAKTVLDLEGTIEDFSKFYGVSEGNVRATIARKMFDKPKRRVYYRFSSFQKIAPDRWRKNLSEGKSNNSQ